MTVPPRRFRAPVLLIVGCGDIGLRVAGLLRGRWRLLALTSDRGRVATLRAAGIVPLVGDLDAPASLARLAGLADAVLHLAPPAGQGRTDARTGALLAALARRGGPRRLVYVGTTGIYGDCGGAWVDETRAARPATDRARRRVDAESRLRRHGRTHGACVSLLRAPGIYAFDRAGGDPRERVARGLPALAPPDDPYTNHIHADDMARACVAALHRGRSQRAVNVCDDGALRMGEFQDLVAELAGLEPPPRVTLAEAGSRLSEMRLSFLRESRRLRNQRLHEELRLVLRYPTVRDAFPAPPAPALRAAHFELHPDGAPRPSTTLERPA